jgi:uncharacterized protein YaaQ
MDPIPEARSILLLAVVQAQDMENAQKGLEEINLRSSVLPSIGGFLGQKNNTLLIGCSEEQLSDVIRILKENCHQRIEYMALPMDNTSIAVQLVTPMPVSVGGATIFSLEVEHQEVI